MAKPVSITFTEVDTSVVSEAKGRVALIVDPEGRLDLLARRINRLTKGALARLIDTKAKKAEVAEAHVIAFPVGMSADALDVVFLSRRASALEARKAGAALGRARAGQDMLLCAGGHRKAAEIALGVALRDYAFDDHKSKAADAGGVVRMMVSKPDEVAVTAGPLLAVAEGVFFPRDLVNEPANVLTTTEFAKRLEDMEDIGLEVE
ncbi:MAG: leucyl aminopeptidase, partial [Rhodobacteraceae bacterium]|nr:leucyl aminopeptidase [Paracoccaceae bacterium]